MHALARLTRFAERASSADADWYSLTSSSTRRSVAVVIRPRSLPMGHPRERMCLDTDADGVAVAVGTGRWGYMVGDGSGGC